MRVPLDIEAFKKFKEDGAETGYIKQFHQAKLIGDLKEVPFRRVREILDHLAVS